MDSEGLTLTHALLTLISAAGSSPITNAPVVGDGKHLLPLDGVHMNINPEKPMSTPDPCDVFQYHTCKCAEVFTPHEARPHVGKCSETSQQTLTFRRKADGHESGTVGGQLQSQSPGGNLPLVGYGQLLTTQC